MVSVIPEECENCKRTVGVTINRNGVKSFELAPSCLAGLIRMLQTANMEVSEYYCGCGYRPAYIRLSDGRTITITNPQFGLNK